MNPPPASLRVDKWLWQARFFKSRSLAADVVKSSRLRLNGERVAKGATPVKPGDVLTFPQAKRIRIIEVVAIGTRRGPAAEAAELYNDLTPPDDAPAAVAPKPTQRDRRAAAKAKRQLPT